MRYLFVVGHPAHVHLFKNVMRTLSGRGHEVFAAAVRKEQTTALLEALGIRHAVIGGNQRSLITKALGLFPKEIALLKVARDFQPDVLISTGSPYAAHVSALLDKPHLAFGDTENASLTARITIPFTDALYTPDCFEGNLGPKHRKYRGYKELAYLHPKYFRPNRDSLRIVGLSESEPYLVVRLASWDASHDIGDRGFSFRSGEERFSFLKDLERLGRVVLTSDQPIGPPLNEYTISLQPELMHDVLAFADMYIGEGATMAAEAGVLGVPWFFVSTTGRGFLADQQRGYGLGFWVRNRAELVEALAHMPRRNVRAEWMSKRERMLADKEDVVSFISHAVETWPLSP